MTGVEVVSVVKDSVLGLCGIATAVFAGLGLRTWKQQIAGHLALDTARRVVLAAYRVRDAIQQLRSPWQFHAEEVDALTAAGIPAEQHSQVLSDRQRVTGILYQRRWDKVVAAKSELDLAYLESEVLWGTLLEEPMGRVKQTMLDLLQGIEQYVTTQDRPQDRYLSAADIRSRVFDTGRDDDPIATGIRIWTFAFQDAMRPHLGP